MQTDQTDKLKPELTMYWSEMSPGFKYYFLNDSAAASFLEDHFGQTHVRAFNNLKPGAMKADFLRLAWLYEKGGFVIDIDREPENLETYASLADIVFPQSYPGEHGDDSCQGHVYNGFMGVKRRSKLIKSALDIALRRSLSNWATPHDLPLTVPCLMCFLFSGNLSCVICMFKFVWGVSYPF